MSDNESASPGIRLLSAYYVCISEFFASGRTIHRRFLITVVIPISLIAYLRFSDLFTGYYFNGRCHIYDNTFMKRIQKFERKKWFFIVNMNLIQRNVFCNLIKFTGCIFTFFNLYKLFGKLWWNIQIHIIRQKVTTKFENLSSVNIFFLLIIVSRNNEKLCAPFVYDKINMHKSTYAVIDLSWLGIWRKMVNNFNINEKTAKRREKKKDAISRTQ